MKNTLAFIFILLMFNCLSAQTQPNLPHDIFRVLEDEGNAGSVRIFQDSSIYRLIQRDIAIHKKSEGIPDGYRIQIISVSGRNAREESQLAKLQFMTYYPDFDPSQVYSVYQAPFFKVRIGNYRDKFEALKFYKEVLKNFPNAYLIKGQIDYPVIE